MRVLTFDIEDWFHILDNESTSTEESWSRFPARLEENTERVLSIVEEKGAKATFFCLGWVAKYHPSVVRKIADAGHEIGSHSYGHKLVYEMSPSAFVADLRKSIRLLEDLTGQRIRAYRAPGFSLRRQHAWVFDALSEQGIEIDCSIFPARRAHGGFPGFGEANPVLVRTDAGVMKEFPVNIRSMLGMSWVFSGGGYFRLFPYRLIRHWGHQASYLMTYFHPRDFDPSQPVIAGLSWLRRFRTYWGLGSAEAKLRRLLDDLPFTDLAGADAEVEWKAAREIDLRTQMA